MAAKLPPERGTRIPGEADETPPSSRRSSIEGRVDSLYHQSLPRDLSQPVQRQIFWTERKVEVLQIAGFLGVVVGGVVVTVAAGGFPLLVLAGVVTVVFLVKLGVWAFGGRQSTSEDSKQSPKWQGSFDQARIEKQVRSAILENRSLIKPRNQGERVLDRMCRESSKEFGSPPDKQKIYDMVAKEFVQSVEVYFEEEGRKTLFVTPLSIPKEDSLTCAVEKVKELHEKLKGALQKLNYQEEGADLEALRLIFACRQSGVVDASQLFTVFVGENDLGAKHAAGECGYQGGQKVIISFKQDVIELKQSIPYAIRVGDDKSEFVEAFSTCSTREGDGGECWIELRRDSQVPAALDLFDAGMARLPSEEPPGVGGENAGEIATFPARLQAVSDQLEKLKTKQKEEGYLALVKPVMQFENLEEFVKAVYEEWGSFTQVKIVDEGVEKEFGYRQIEKMVNESEIKSPAGVKLLVKANVEELYNTLTTILKKLGKTEKEAEQEALQYLCICKENAIDLEFMKTMFGERTFPNRDQENRPWDFKPDWRFSVTFKTSKQSFDIVRDSAFDLYTKNSRPSEDPVIRSQEIREIWQIEEKLIDGQLEVYCVPRQLGRKSHYPLNDLLQARMIHLPQI